MRHCVVGSSEQVGHDIKRRHGQWSWPLFPGCLLISSLLKHHQLKARRSADVWIGMRQLDAEASDVGKIGGVEGR